MVSAGLFQIEEVTGKAALRRFLELPYALHHRDPRWAPLLMAFERWRLDPDRNPYFERGDAAYFLVRRAGRVTGRIAAHVEAEDTSEGRFGFFAVDDDPDGGTTVALLDAARAWLGGKGCRTIRGPLSFTEEDEAGVLHDGFDAPGLTGRPWHPPWYTAQLVAAGLRPAGDRPTYRLPAEGDAPFVAADEEPPPHAGHYADRSLVVGAPSGGRIAAVPDVAGAQRSSSGLRGAWTLARRARARAWEGCVVVQLHGDAGDLVPRLQAAAGKAGYSWVVAPWAPDERAPETVHRLFTGPVP